MNAKYWTGSVCAVNRSRNVLNLFNKQVNAGSDVFIAPNAVVAGDVELGNKASVFYGAVLRGRSNYHFENDF